MSALQSIDTALFRFINGTMQNPFFDRVMPLFAGGGWFIGFVLLVGAGLIWKGGARGRLCALLLALSIGVCDGFITNPIKHAFERPRPCAALDNVHELVGCGGSGSMPSAHSSNCFAAAVVLWLFYRRSLRFALPIAGLVAFSRVYNGAHYPTDVLVGAALGAGTAVAVVFGLNRFWQFIGGTWFPLWLRALPSLVLQPDPAPSPSAARAQAPLSATADSHWLHLGWLFIALVLVGKWIYLRSSRIELSEHEAVQWLWSKHLSLLSFHGSPLAAWGQWISTHLFGDHEFGVRFFAPVSAALTSFVALRFLAKNVSARAGFWLVAICNVTPLFTIHSTLMTGESLLLLFTTLALFTGWRAVQPDGQTRHWALVGLWLGLACLGQPIAFGSWLGWITFFVLWKPARLHLHRPGPYVALAINGLCALPWIIWITRHGWNTAAPEAGINPGSPLEFLGWSAALLHPIFLAAAAWAAIALWRRSARDPLPRFLFAQGVPFFLVCWLLTLHWPVPIQWLAGAIIPLFGLMILFWEQPWRNGARALRPLLASAMFLGLTAVIVLHDTDIPRKTLSLTVPPAVDPLRPLRGWSQMARLVERERRKLAGEGRDVFIIGDRHGTTSLLSFYLPQAKASVTTTPLVYDRGPARTDASFRQWPDYTNSRLGQNALYVRDNNPGPEAPPDLLSQFASVREVGRFPVIYRGRILRHVQIFACRNLQP